MRSLAYPSLELRLSRVPRLILQKLQEQVDQPRIVGDDIRIAECLQIAVQLALAPLQELFGQTVAEAFAGQREVAQVRELLLDGEVQVVEVVEAAVCLPVVVQVGAARIDLGHVDYVDGVGGLQIIADSCE